MHLNPPFVREEAVHFLRLAEQEHIIGTQSLVGEHQPEQEAQLFLPLLPQLITCGRMTELAIVQLAKR